LLRMPEVVVGRHFGLGSRSVRRWLNELCGPDGLSGLGLPTGLRHDAR
jgi:hypothetical protein